MKNIANLMIRIALGVASVLVPLAFVVTYATIGFNGSSKNPWLVALALLAMISLPSVAIYYIVVVYRNENIAKDKKGLWVAILFFGNVFAFPVFWYKYFWRTRGDRRHTVDSLPRKD